MLFVLRLLSVSLSLGFFIETKANALTWISCDCRTLDRAVDKSNKVPGYGFKRACYSSNSCETCCGYERANGEHCIPAKQAVNTTAKQDHETPNITLMEDGPRP